MQTSSYGAYHGSHNAPLTPGKLSTHALNFSEILHEVDKLEDDKMYIFFEFDCSGKIYSSRTIQGASLKSRMRNLAWHTSHSYRVLETNQLKSPVVVGVGHRMSGLVGKILH